MAIETRIVDGMIRFNLAITRGTVEPKVVCPDPETEGIINWTKHGNNMPVGYEADGNTLNPSQNEPSEKPHVHPGLTPILKAAARRPNPLGKTVDYLMQNNGTAPVAELSREKKLEPRVIFDLAKKFTGIFEISDGKLCCPALKLQTGKP